MMSKLRDWLKGTYVPLALAVIIVSLGGSLILLAYQGAKISRQTAANESSLEELKGVNEELQKLADKEQEDTQRLIQENQKQTRYIECLLARQGVLTDAVKSDCERQAEAAQQSGETSPNTSSNSSRLQGRQSDRQQGSNSNQSTGGGSTNDPDDPSEPLFPLPLTVCAPSTGICATN